MAPNHWFQRHICGTNGAEAQLCQNSPQKSCSCAVVHDYWAGHLYMHTQQRVWYLSRLLWPLAFKSGLALLGMQPTQAPLQGIISGRWSLMRKNWGWGERERERSAAFPTGVRVLTSVLIWWTIAQRLHLLGLPSYPFCPWLQSNFCHQTSWQPFDCYAAYFCVL